MKLFFAYFLFFIVGCCSSDLVIKKFIGFGFHAASLRDSGRGDAMVFATINRCGRCVKPFIPPGKEKNSSAWCFTRCGEATVAVIAESLRALRETIPHYSLHLLSTSFK
jgi:hypothetical protein